MIDETNSLEHYGTPRHSGRYPWGSGKDPQRSKDFLQSVRDLKKEGVSEVDIAKSMGMNTAELRAKISKENAYLKAANMTNAAKLYEKGVSKSEISRRLGIPVTTVSLYLDPSRQLKEKGDKTVADVLKEQLKEKPFLNTTKGANIYLGVTEDRMKKALKNLQEEGYSVNEVYVEQLGTGKRTTLRILSEPGVSKKEAWEHRYEIQPVEGVIFQDNGIDGVTKAGGPPKQISMDRVAIRYAEEGGTNKDGVIEIRRGVKDLDLGDAHYAQCRIAIDDKEFGKLFAKGMVVYSDDIPEGKDILVNSNKKIGTQLDKVLKPQKDNPDNPFGSTYYRKEYEDENGKKQLSALNVMNEEGDWNKWSRTLASQELSKQSVGLAKQQLNIARDLKLDEYNEIMSIANPTIRKQQLIAFADECDSAAVHLKAASMPRQATAVILPVNSLKEDEIYAPRLENGESVILIRHPHQGRFEIPRLTVNNNNAEAKKVIGNASFDAVGIHHEVAVQLSGADFDGDNVLVIPDNRGLWKNEAPIKSLQTFDADIYANPKDVKPAWKKGSQREGREMGMASNLITDMTLKNAEPDEIVRATKYAMVVIDVAKHNLNYKAAYEDLDIASLKKKYQAEGGSSTLISRSKSPTRVTKRSERYEIDPETGEKIYLPAKDAYYKNAKGELVPRLQESTKMAEAKDARSLISQEHFAMEEVYADYANSMKSLGNRARKDSLFIEDIPYNPSAKKVFKEEVDSLNSKLQKAYSNKPREQQVQLLANQEVERQVADNPEILDDKEGYKKLKGRTLTAMRSRMGVKKESIQLTEKEVDAIQSGAITKTKLNEILANTDDAEIKKWFMPRKSTELTPAKIATARSLLNSGYTLSEVSQNLGVSVTTLENQLQ